MALGFEGCDHPSKGLLLGDISEESREAAAWTLILLGGEVAQLSESSSVSLGRAGPVSLAARRERVPLATLGTKSP